MTDVTSSTLTDAETLRAAAAKVRSYQDVLRVGPLALYAEPLAALLESSADDLDGDLRPLLNSVSAERAEVLTEAVAANYEPALRLARTILDGVDRG